MNNDFPAPGFFDPLGKAGADQFAALVAAEQAKINGTKQSGAAEQKIAAFVNEQPGAIRQEAGAVDQNALQFLQSWRRENPNATSQQLATYERDIASVLAGRRFGETHEQFNARTKAGEAATPATQEDGYSLVAHLPPDIEPEDTEGLGRILDTAQNLGVAEETVNEIFSAIAQTATTDNPLPANFSAEPFEMYGFTINPAEIGGEYFEDFQLDRYDPQLQIACKLARERGIGQQQLNQLMRAYFQAEAS